MSTQRSAYTQYRTFDHLYTIKEKKDESIYKVRVFDIFQKLVLEQSFSGSCERLRGQFSIGKEVVFAFLAEMLNKENLPEDKNNTTKEECLDDIYQLINQHKSTLVEESEELKDLTCPITLEVFSHPVDDEHGHTFEKRAIEEHLKRGGSCPLSREPIVISSLRPNRTVQNEIEKRKNYLIPNLSLFEKEKAKMVLRHLEMAQVLIDDEEYNDALVSFSQAFRFTRNWADYAKLPLLFSKMGQEKKAALAYLYLAEYQLKDGDNKEALQTLEKCSQNEKLALEVNLLISKVCEIEGEREKALKIQTKEVEELSRKSPERAISLYKKILNQNPNYLELYPLLAGLLKNTREKSHVLLKGATHAIAVQDYNMAGKLCEELEITTVEQALLFLEILKNKEDHELLEKKLLSATKFFQEKEMYRDLLKISKLLYWNNPIAQYCEKVVTAYEELRQTGEHNEWTITLLGALIEEKNWSTAEEVAKKALGKFEKIPIYEKLETVYSNWHSHELSSLMRKLGKAYEQNSQLQAAKKTYSRAYKRFQTFDHVIGWAGILYQQGKTKQSIKIYCEAFRIALLGEDHQKLSICLGEMESVAKFEYIDPLVTSLTEKKEQGLIKGKLFFAAKAFKEKEMYEDFLKVSKVLYGCSRSAQSCVNIVTAYEKMKKKRRQSVWTKQLLVLLISEKNWPKAEEVAEQALEEFDKIPIYKLLKVVYSNWHTNKLSDLMDNLGKAYALNNQLDLAEKTYRRAYKNFHTFEHAVGLAKTLKKKGEIKQSVKAYYVAASVALLSGDYQKLSICVEKIQSIDPSIQWLNENEKMYLLTQKHILSLSLKLATVEKTLKAEREKPPCLIGKADWEQRFGEVGEEPPLPLNINEILRSIDKDGNRVLDTHILVLIPKTVNGIPLTLKSFWKLLHTKNVLPSRIESEVSVPRDNDLRLGEYREVFESSPASSHWVLISKDCVPFKPVMRETKRKAAKLYEVAVGYIMYKLKTGEQIRRTCLPINFNLEKECSFGRYAIDCNNLNTLRVIDVNDYRSKQRKIKKEYEESLRGRLRYSRPAPGPDLNLGLVFKWDLEVESQTS